MSEILEFPTTLEVSAAPAATDFDDFLGIGDSLDNLAEDHAVAEGEAIGGMAVALPEGTVVDLLATDQPTTNNEPAADAVDADSSGSISSAVQPSEGNAAGSSEINHPLLPGQFDVDDSPKLVVVELTDEQIAERKAKHAAKIHRAETYLSSCVISHKLAREQVKAWKKRIDNAADELESLRGANWNDDDEDGSNEESESLVSIDSPTAEQATEAVSHCAKIVAANDQSDNAWRSVKTADAIDFDKIDGFGKKKREALLEVAPTLGALEDLRAAGGIHGFQSVLPKGIGKNNASDLEDALLNWLAKNRDRAVLAEAAAEASTDTLRDVITGDATAATESATEAVDATSDIGSQRAAPSSVAKIQAESSQVGSELKEVLSEVIGDGIDQPAGTLEPAPVDDNSLPSDAIDARVIARAKELNSGEPNCLAPKSSDNKFWESGYEAADQGAAITDCPYIPGVECDDWLRGFMGFEKLQSFDGDANEVASTEVADDDKPAEQPTKPKRTRKSKKTETPS